MGHFNFMYKLDQIQMTYPTMHQEISVDMYLIFHYSQLWMKENNREFFSLQKKKKIIVSTCSKSY